MVVVARGRGGLTPLVTLVAVVTVVTLATLAVAEVELDDHGYKGIVIAINPYLKQDDVMLARLEVRMEGSRVQYLVLLGWVENGLKMG